MKKNLKYMSAIMLTATSLGTLNLSVSNVLAMEKEEQEKTNNVRSFCELPSFNSDTVREFAQKKTFFGHVDDHPAELKPAELPSNFEQQVGCQIWSADGAINRLLGISGDNSVKSFAQTFAKGPAGAPLVGLHILHLRDFSKSYTQADRLEKMYSYTGTLEDWYKHMNPYFNSWDYTIELFNENSKKPEVQKNFNKMAAECNQAGNEVLWNFGLLERTYMPLIQDFCDSAKKLYACEDSYEKFTNELSRQIEKYQLLLDKMIGGEKFSINLTAKEWLDKVEEILAKRPEK